MITAKRTQNGKAEAVIDGETLTIGEGFDFLQQDFKNFAPQTQEGNPEKLFFLAFLEPLGFKVTKDTADEKEPEEVY